ncbi:hypothetical protein BHE74_00042749, partial [Ensete ventricosum]
QTQRGGWAASHGQASYRGGRPRPGHLQGGDRLWPRPPAKGRVAATKAPCTGGDRCLRARSSTVRSQGTARQRRGRRGSARHLRRGSTDGTEREEDLGHSF